MKCAVCGVCKFRTDDDKCMIWNNAKIAYLTSPGCSKGVHK